MQPISSLLGLPSSLLLLLAAQVTDTQADGQQLPTAVRRMGIDAGEKFFQEYYAFQDDSSFSRVGSQSQGLLTPAEASLLAANSSASIPYRAPYAAHLYGGTSPGAGRDLTDHGWGLFHRARWAEESLLAKRDFTCPTGSSDCASIGYPDSCCQSGTTCVHITDTGLGPVGCCPDAESCTGTIACSGGQEGCSSESGGGCCIDGFACASVGCE